jgi:hypothetical protein
MKKFIYRTAIFLTILIVVDIIWGLAFDKIESRIEIGGTGRNNYICNQVSDDILIFGSSRAESHYNAQMMMDSLGLSCYNCGESGCGIVLNYGRLLLLLERQTPKLVIYELTPEYDYLKGEKDIHKGLTFLKNYRNKDGINSLFQDFDRIEPYKLTSGLYRHNSSFFKNIISYFFNLSFGSGIRGFRPIDQPLDTMKIKKDYIPYDSNEGYDYDSMKLKYFRNFLAKTQDIKTIIVVSPMWYGQDDAVLDSIKPLCNQEGVFLLNYANSPKYNHKDQFFVNGTHLNATGADEFTRDLIKDIEGLNILHK